MGYLGQGKCIYGRNVGYMGGSMQYIDGRKAVLGESMKA